MELAFILLSLVVAEHHAWQESTPFRDTDREIVLVDATLFRVRRDYAEHMAFVAKDHKQRFRLEVEGNNRPFVAWKWSEECDWRERCWRELADSLDDGDYERWCNRPTYRIHALYRLRDLLGHEAFYAGQMPSPTPQYKFLPNR